MEKIIKQSKEQKKEKNFFKDNKKALIIGGSVIGILLVILLFFGKKELNVQVQSGIAPTEVEKSVEEVVRPIYEQNKKIQEQQKELLSSIKELNSTLKQLNENLSKRPIKQRKTEEKKENKGLSIIPSEIIQGKEVQEEEEVTQKPVLNHISTYSSSGLKAPFNKQDITPIPQPVKKKKEKPSVYIPAGSIVEGRLLYGFIAPERGMLPPVVLEFTKPIRTANDFYIPAQKCLITTSAQYDISQGLAILGGLKSTLSCVLKSGKVVEIPVNIAVGEEKTKDGLVQIGLTGKEKWLTKEDFAKISSMGTITGIASGMQQGLVEQSITPQGNVVTAIKDRGLYAVLQGVNQGTQKFFEFWMRKYERKVPAIVVQPKQRVFIVFVKGADLGIEEKEI